jgi:hypothetical protein
MYSEVTGTVQCRFSQKFAVTIDTHAKGGKVGTTTSAPLFKDSTEAIEAGYRATRLAKETGQFPNMCEKF